jgi:hypothetical protein
MAQGFVIVGTTSASAVGSSKGTPMADGKAPTHRHTYKTEFFLESKFLSAVSGCCNDSGAKPTTVTQEGLKTADATSNDPFLQLLVCQKEY